MDSHAQMNKISADMRVSTAIAFKEWAVVVDALGRGTQSVILRKGGISERRGEFQVEHQQFWLFPTRFHEAEDSVVPGSRSDLRQIAASAPTGIVEISLLAVTDTVVRVASLESLQRLRGRHIWNDHVLEQRFHFGREPGLHAILARIYRRTATVRIPLLESYGGCKSWIELAEPIAGDLTPVLDDAAFDQEREVFHEQLGCHACSET